MNQLRYLAVAQQQCAPPERQHSGQYGTCGYTPSVRKDSGVPAVRPFRLWYEFHECVGRYLCILERLFPHLHVHGCDAQGRLAAKVVCEFFDQTLQLHHATEERVLFSELAHPLAGPDAVCLRELTAVLCREHQELQRLWGELRMGLKAIAARRSSPIEPSLVSTFIGLCLAHAAREEDELLAIAKRMLPDAVLMRIDDELGSSISRALRR